MMMMMMMMNVLLEWLTCDRFHVKTFGLETGKCWVFALD